MKYIKRFNERKEELGNTYLAYLLDKDFNCVYKELDFGNEGFSITKGEGVVYLNGILVQDNIFSWDAIKDDLIPFLLMLNSEYGIEWISVNRLDHKGDVMVSKDEFINDTLVAPRISKINIAIE